jgi:hypothetical protein
MSDDKKAVPEPGEADREDEIHYHEVDETNVGDTEQPRKARLDQAQQPEGDE